MRKTYGVWEWVQEGGRAYWKLICVEATRQGAKETVTKKTQSPILPWRPRALRVEELPAWMLDAYRRGCNIQVQTSA